MTLTLDRPRDRPTTWSLEIADHPPASGPPTPATLWAATEAAWRRSRPGRSATASHPRDARHAYAVLTGLTSAGGGMVAAATTCAARARASRPQLRLPLRLDPRPVLRGPGRRRRTGRTRCWTTPSAFITERLLADGPGLRPPTPLTGDPVPDERKFGPARLPRRGRIVGQPRQRPVPARRASARRSCCSLLPPARPAGPDHWRAVRSPPRPSSSAGTTPTPASGSSTTSAGRTPG